MSPTRGFSIELGAAITVLLASRLGLPVSTTQCLTGAALGVALMVSTGDIQYAMHGLMTDLELRPWCRELATDGQDLLGMGLDSTLRWFNRGLVLRHGAECPIVRSSMTWLDIIPAMFSGNCVTTGLFYLEPSCFDLQRRDI